MDNLSAYNFPEQEFCSPYPVSIEECTSVEFEDDNETTQVCCEFDFQLPSSLWWFTRRYVKTSQRF